MACSRPTAPAIVSRSDSVQVASASSRAIAARSPATPDRPRQLSTSRAAPTPATSQRVATSTTRPASTAAAARDGPVSWAQRRSRPVSPDGRGGSPRTAATNRNSPVPATAPATMASRPGPARAGLTSLS